MRKYDVWFGEHQLTFLRQYVAQGKSPKVSAAIRKAVDTMLAEVYAEYTPEQPAKRGRRKQVAGV